jgi:hypothetical protein
MSPRHWSSIRAVAVVLALGGLLALPAAARAQSLNGSFYAAQGGSVPVFFNISVTGQTFVATILTFGNGGNGRWFAAFGTTDGTSGTGQVLNPSGFALTQPPGGSFSFQLDQPGGATGTFTTQGLQTFLSITSGRMVRIFP